MQELNKIIINDNIDRINHGKQLTVPLKVLLNSDLFLFKYKKIKGNFLCGMNGVNNKKSIKVKCIKCEEEFSAFSSRCIVCENCKEEYYREQSKFKSRNRLWRKKHEL